MIDPFYAGEMRRNQHALHAASTPRRPCCSLYSARVARSGL